LLYFSFFVTFCSFSNVDRETRLTSRELFFLSPFSYLFYSLSPSFLFVLLFYFFASKPERAEETESSNREFLRVRADLQRELRPFFLFWCFFSFSLGPERREDFSSPFLFLSRREMERFSGFWEKDREQEKSLWVLFLLFIGLRGRWVAATLLPKERWNRGLRELLLVVET
jgi:hypothetical protein